MIKGPGFEFFNRLSGTISVKTSEEPERIGNLLNLKSTPTAKLVDVTWEPEVYQRDNDEPFRDLTDAEWEQIVFDCQTDWFGGIDVHHIFFEGIKVPSGATADSVGVIGWGS